jgi:hypothetical protein
MERINTYDSGANLSWMTTGVRPAGAGTLGASGGDSEAVEAARSAADSTREMENQYGLGNRVDILA